jgi:hypothetical protein
LAHFLKGVSLDLARIARAAKGDVTPAGRKFWEILRRLTGTFWRMAGVKSEGLTPPFPHLIRASPESDLEEVEAKDDSSFDRVKILH